MGFTYTILDPNPGGTPLIELSIADGYSVSIDGIEQTLANLRFYFGYVEWGGGNNSYIVDMMFNDDPDSVLHHIYQLGGDPIGIGADMTIAEMQALEMTITGIGAITSGVFAPGEFIPFSAIPYLLDIDPEVDVINGTSGEDVYYVGDGSDWVAGGEGDDEIYGEGGNDELLGEEGNDKLSGGDGDDILDGGIGNDNLHGDAGNDTLYGGDGDDKMFGGVGADHLEGGDGGDKIHASSGDDTVLGGDGADTVLAGSGDDDVSGGAGDDVLMGQGGHDTISGGQGNDLILGGAGDDVINGGAGKDVLIGGNGADTFVFDDTIIGTNVIKDFDAGEGDQLDLSAYLLAHTEIEVTDAADFISTYVTDTGRDLVIDFGNGDIIELEKVSSLDELEAGLLI